MALVGPRLSTCAQETSRRPRGCPFPSPPPGNSLPATTTPTEPEPLGMGEPRRHAETHPDGPRGSCPGMALGQHIAHLLAFLQT